MIEKIQHKMVDGHLTSLFLSTEAANLSSTRGRHFSTTQSNLSSVKEKPKISTAKESQRICLSYTPQILFLRGTYIFLMETQDFTGSTVLSFTHTVSSIILLYSQ